MSWTYSQSTGILSHGEPLGKGYSGHGQGLNNPKLQMVHNLGPIPKGIWEIGMWFDDPHLGVCVAALRPTDQDVFGRGGFFIHGDNFKMNYTAMKNSKENTIEVL